MAKRPGKGRCVHCLKEGVERNWGHVFPQSWYPNTTAADLEKWQIPSCVACNDRYGKLERDLIGRLGLALDVKTQRRPGLPRKHYARSIQKQPRARATQRSATLGQRRFYAKCTKEKSLKERT